MGVTYTVKSFAELRDHLSKLLKKKQERIKDEAIKKTLDLAVVLIKQNAPVALGDIIKSVHSDGKSKVIVDAPHAAAVEVGSRPHTPPLAPLIEWAKQQEWTALGGDPEKLAIAVQHAIAVHGTKPTFFVRNELTEVGKELLSQIRTALDKEE